MWLHMHRNGTWVTFRTRHDTGQSKDSWLLNRFGLRRPTQMHLNYSPSSKTIDKIQHLVSLRWRLMTQPVHHPNKVTCLNVTTRHGLRPDLVAKDSENHLWLRLSICLWDDGIFILAAMNYWGVESAASRTGVCTCVCECVCIHVWWDLLEDNLMLRLTSTSHTSYFSYIQRFHIRCHAAIHLASLCAADAKILGPFPWSHEVICL